MQYTAPHVASGGGSGGRPQSKACSPPLGSCSPASAATLRSAVRLMVVAVLPGGLGPEGEAGQRQGTEG